MNRRLLLLPFLLLAAVIGCSGQGPKYTNVKGTVKYNGKPVEKGFVTFKVEGMPPSSIDIVDGEFHGQAMVGTNKVSVSALKKAAGGSGPRLDAHAKGQVQGYMKYKREDRSGDPDIDPTTMVDYIPKEWGSQSTHTLVVEAGAPNEFPISIKGN
jgi:hypothetical protein